MPFLTASPQVGKYYTWSNWYLLRCRVNNVRFSLNFSRLPEEPRACGILNGPVDRCTGSHTQTCKSLRIPWHERAFALHQQWAGATRCYTRPTQLYFAWLWENYYDSRISPPRLSGWKFTRHVWLTPSSLFFSYQNSRDNRCIACLVLSFSLSWFYAQLNCETVWHMSILVTPEFLQENTGIICIRDENLLQDDSSNIHKSTCAWSSSSGDWKYFNWILGYVW